MELHTQSAKTSSRRTSNTQRPGGNTTVRPSLDAQAIGHNDKLLAKLGFDAEQRALLAQHGETQTALHALFGGDPPQVAIGQNAEGRPSIKILGEPRGPIVLGLAAIGETLLAQGMHAAALPYLASLAVGLDDPQAGRLPLGICCQAMLEDKARLPLASFMALIEHTAEQVQQGQLDIQFVDMLERIGERQYATALRAKDAQDLLQQWKQQKGAQQAATLAQLMDLVKLLDKHLPQANPQDLQIHLTLLKDLWKELGYLRILTASNVRLGLLGAIASAVDATSQSLVQKDVPPPPNEPELLSLCAHFCDLSDVLMYDLLPAHVRDALCSRATALFAEGRLPVATLEQFRCMVEWCALSAPGCELLLEIIQHHIDHLKDQPFFQRQQTMGDVCERLILLSKFLTKLGKEDAVEVCTELMQRLVDSSKVPLVRDALAFQLKEMIARAGPAHGVERRRSAMNESRERMDWYMNNEDVRAALERYQDGTDARAPSLSQHLSEQLRQHLFACARAGMPARTLQELVDFSAQVFPQHHQPDLMALALLEQVNDTVPKLAHEAFDRYLQLATSHPDPQHAVFSEAGLRQLARTCAQMPTLTRPKLLQKGQDRLEQVLAWAVEHQRLTPLDAQRCRLWFFLEMARATTVSHLRGNKGDNVEEAMQELKTRSTVLHFGPLQLMSDSSHLLRLAKLKLLELATPEERLAFLQQALRCERRDAAQLLLSWWESRPGTADGSGDGQDRHEAIGGFIKTLIEELRESARLPRMFSLVDLPGQLDFNIDHSPEWDVLSQAVLAFVFRSNFDAANNAALPRFIVNLALGHSSWERRVHSGIPFMTALMHTVSFLDTQQAPEALRRLVDALLGSNNWGLGVLTINPERGAMAAAMLLAVLEQHDPALAKSLGDRHRAKHSLLAVYLGMVRTRLALNEERHADALRHWYAAERQLRTALETPGVALPEDLRESVEALRSQVQVVSEQLHSDAQQRLSLSSGPGG